MLRATAFLTAIVLCILVINGSISHTSFAQPGGLQVRDYQGVSYVSGGVGLEEREALAAMASQFNLKLTFAMQSGNYVSDIAVRIADQAGNTVLETTSDGPLLYARLAPGRYNVQVSGAGQSFERQARVGSRQAQLGFYWR